MAARSERVSGGNAPIGMSLLALLLALGTFAPLSAAIAQTQDAPVAEATPDAGATPEASEAAASDVAVEPAPEVDQSLDEAARLTFRSGRNAFVEGNYERALELFRQAYELSGRPGLLYNIAQALDRLRRDADTIEALQQYLRLNPETPNRSEVDSRIRVLVEAVARELLRAQEREAAQRAAEAPEPVAPEPEPSFSMHPAVFLGTAAVAVVAAGVGLATGLQTLSLNDEYQAATSRDQALPLYDDANSFQLLTNVMFISAGVFAAASTALLFFTDWSGLMGDSEADDDAAEVAAISQIRVSPQIAVSPEGASLGLLGSF